MVDMTAFVGQSAQRWSISGTAKQIVLDSYQSGGFQQLAQTLDGKSATVTGGTGVVLSSGKINDPSSTYGDSLPIAPAI